MTTQSIDSFL